MYLTSEQWKRCLSRLTSLLKQLATLEFNRFSDFVSIEDGEIRIKNIPRSPGVYVIFEGKKPIYIGSTGKGAASLKTRFRDLFYVNMKRYPDSVKPSEPFNHTLTYKLTSSKKTGRFRHPDKTRKFYLTKCSFKVVETRNVNEARALESILILQLQPEYNE